MDNTGKINLTDLIDVNVLQQIQDGFSNFTGMAALTTDSDGVPVTDGSGFTNFCMNLTRKSEVGCKRCEICDRDGAIVTMKTGRPSVYECHAGLVDFAAPILVDGTMIGSFIGGQVRIVDVDDKKMSGIAKELNIDPVLYVEEAKKTNMLSRERIEKAAEFLSEIAKVLSEMAYRNYIALQQSRRQTLSAQSQLDFFINMSNYMHKNVECWLENAKHSLEEDNHQNMRTTIQDILSTGTDVLSGVDGMSEYLKMTGGSASLSEENYNIRRLMQKVKNHVLAEAKQKNAQCIINIDDDIPELMMGDANRIFQITARLMQSIVDLSEDAKAEAFIGCERKTYSVILTIKVLSSEKFVSAELWNEIQKYLKSDNIFESKIGWDSEHGLPVIGLLIHQMFGSIDLINTESSDTEVIIKLPQLEIKGGA